MHSLVVVIAICWIVFWLYWIVSAFGSKKSTAPNIKQFVSARIVMFILAITLALFFNRLPQSFRNHFPVTNSIALAFGFGIFLLGLFVAVWARLFLGKNWGMPMTKKQNPELVTAGPYRYIRHPIYSGILLMILGSAVDINTYWLLVFVIADIYFLYSAVMEEKLMLQQFPKTYPPYQSKTKMLIPFIL